MAARSVQTAPAVAQTPLPIFASTSSVVLFTLAAFTEGFLSPSPLPYIFKAFWAILSSGLMSFYFVILGFPRQAGGGPARLPGRLPATPPPTRGLATQGATNAT